MWSKFHRKGCEEVFGEVGKVFIKILHLKNMRVKNLQEKIKMFNEFINSTQTDRTETERKLLKVSKLPEEVGEFYNEFLISFNFAREWKNRGSDNLSTELADVILTCLVIAEELEIDIFSVIEQKMDVICERFDLKE